MKNPITTWWNDHVIQTIRNRYRYNLLVYARRHKYEQTKGGWFLPIGLVLWIGIPAIGQLSGFYWLNLNLSLLVFLFFALLPIVAGFFETYRLKPKLTLTMNVVPDNPENTYPKRLTLRGVEFGAPMQSKQELIAFMEGLDARMTNKAAIKKFLVLRSRSPKVLDADAEKLMQLTREQEMRLYPMYAIGDEVPSLIMFPGIPENIMRPREERVGLSYNFGKIRHATIYALECRAVKTSIEVKKTIIDVEYALFAPFITQHDLDIWLENGNWFVPNRVTQEVATYVKQQVDTTKNATTFGVLEMQRDVANAGMKAVKVTNTDTSMKAKSSEDAYRKLHDKPKGTWNYFWYLASFGLGVLITFLYLR